MREHGVGRSPRTSMRWRFPWRTWRPPCRSSWRFPWWPAWFPRRPLWSSWTPRRPSRWTPRRLGTWLGLGSRRPCGGSDLRSCTDSPSAAPRACVYAAGVHDSCVHGARVHYGRHACGAAGGGSRHADGGGACDVHGSRSLPLVVSLWLPTRVFFGKLTPNNP